MRFTEAQYAAKLAGKPIPRARRGEQWCDLFAAHLRALRIEHEREYRFAHPRRFRFDFALCAPRIAIEIDGGVHRIKNRFDGDREKLNIATSLGWRILRFSPSEVRSRHAITFLEAMTRN